MRGRPLQLAGWAQYVRERGEAVVLGPTSAAAAAAADSAASSSSASTALAPSASSFVDEVLEVEHAHCLPALSRDSHSPSSLERFGCLPLAHDHATWRSYVLAQ